MIRVTMRKTDFAPPVKRLGGMCHTFETLEEISEFYTSALSYVNNTLADGWSRKDSLDWSEYERLLTEL